MSRTVPLLPLSSSIFKHFPSTLPLFPSLYHFPFPSFFSPHPLPFHFFPLSTSVRHILPFFFSHFLLFFAFHSTPLFPPPQTHSLLSHSAFISLPYLQYGFVSIFTIVLLFPLVTFRFSLFCTCILFYFSSSLLTSRFSVCSFSV